MRDRVPEADSSPQKLCADFASTSHTPGLAVGILRDGDVTFRATLGSTGTGHPVNSDTRFRIGSITKLLTALAVAQLHASKLINLDDPAAQRLKHIRITQPPSHETPTLRQLLSHTGAMPRIRSAADALRGSERAIGVPTGRPTPTLDQYYRRPLRIQGKPGTRYSYSNHGFAILGQAVADQSNTPFGTYIQHNVLTPAGMERSGLGTLPKDHTVAAGHDVRGRPLSKTRDPILLPAMGAYSTLNNMLALATTLLEHPNALLEPPVLTSMWQPAYQLHPTLPSIGLGFMLDWCGEHRLVWHGGYWQGYMSALFLAPTPRVGVVVLTNAAQPVVVLAEELIRATLHAEHDKHDTRPHPQSSRWRGLYQPPRDQAPSRWERLDAESSARVIERNGQLYIRTPAWAPSKLRLEPASANPDLFHIRRAGRRTPILFRENQQDAEMILGGLALLRRTRAA